MGYLFISLLYANVQSYRKSQTCFLHNIDRDMKSFSQGCNRDRDIGES